MVIRPGSTVPQAAVPPVPLTTTVPPVPAPCIPPAPPLPLAGGEAPVPVEVAPPALPAVMTREPPDPVRAPDAASPIVPVQLALNATRVASANTTHGATVTRGTMLGPGSDVITASTREGPCPVLRGLGRETCSKNDVAGPATVLRKSNEGQTPNRGDGEHRHGAMKDALAIVRYCGAVLKHECVGSGGR